MNERSSAMPATNTAAQRYEIEDDDLLLEHRIEAYWDERSKAFSAKRRDRKSVV